ncbi:MAG: metallophosphoesterase [Anaerolineae bacterium]
MVLDISALLPRAASALLTMAAGTSLYLYLLNRWLIQMRDVRHKSIAIRAGGILAVVVSGILGYLAAGTWWLIAPAGVLIVAALGEVRRLYDRRRYRGAPPVAQSGAAIRLARPRTTTDLAVRRYRIAAPGWHGRALRIAHISDFHINSHLPLSYFQDAMHRVAEAEPDLVLFTGDFVTYVRYADLLPDVLSLARGRLGTFGILGNHDYWAGADVVAEAVTASGVTLLANGGTRVTTGNGGSVLVAGCELPWSPEPWHPPAPAAGELALILTHTPDNIYRLSKLGAAAIFAGHYHGGQIRLPGVGALVVPSRYGRRFDHGHFVMNGTHLFVTAGVGSAEPPVRLWCQPDVFIVDVQGQDV